MAIIDIGPVDQVVQGIVRKIEGMHAGYVPGSRLAEPSPEAARYGVSVTAGQNAYRVLEEYGWAVVTGRSRERRYVSARGRTVPVGARPSY